MPTPTWAKDAVIRALADHADRRDYGTTRQWLADVTNLRWSRVGEALNVLIRSGRVYTFTVYGDEALRYWLDERRRPRRPAEWWREREAAITKALREPIIWRAGRAVVPPAASTPSPELPPWMPF